MVVCRGGRVELERYRDGVNAQDTRRSWSMAKSMLHAVVGMLVADGALSLHEPAPVPEWSDPGDPRSAITLWHLMTMRSGLEWVEEPGPDGSSDVVEMLAGEHGAPHHDTAAYAAAKPLVASPGTSQLYSSGTSAIVSRVVGDVVGRGAAYRRFLDERLFAPLGMSSAVPRFDESGNWMASSFCFCTARDFARFGQLYLQGGEFAGEQLLSEQWVRTAAIETGRDERGRIHTCHWWRFGDNPWGAFHASGWMGQYIVVVPALDLVVVRLGRTESDRGALDAALGELIASFE